VIILDASVLIGHLNISDANRKAAASLLEAHGPGSFGASPITVAEVLVRPKMEGRSKQVSADIHRLGVAEIPLGKYAAIRLALLRAETNLKMPDCCVLLAAEDGDATGILTLDDRLRASATKLGFHCPDVQP
jgi:predicted nucleic acid-binding protein